MVTGALRSRNRCWIAVAVWLSLFPTEARAQTPTSPETEAVAVRAVRDAMASGNYPWYDADEDAFEPVTPPPPPPSPPTPSRRGWGSFTLQDLGQLIIFMLLTAGLALILVLLARYWQRRLERDEETSGPVSGPAPTPARTGSLPTGLGVDESDPWEAARRLRDRGDYGRAVVLLFAHQLLSLDQHGLIRLARGRTGRQLVRSIGDESIRRSVQRTLRLFEEVYYGHRDPEPEDFEALWSEAEALERRLSPRAAS